MYKSPCRLSLLIALVALGVILNQTVLLAAPEPEKLTFNLYYAGIFAGTAVQNYQDVNGTVQLNATAKSADWLTWAFKIDDRITSISKISDSLLTQVSYAEKIHEGGTRRDKKITFPGDSTAVVEDFRGKTTTVVPVTMSTFDYLSCIMYSRLHKLDPGSSFKFEVYDGKRLLSTTVKVLRRETVKTEAGTFPTVVIQPRLHSGRVFDKNGELLIWMTDDAKHVPVKMTAKIKVGSVSAELVKID